MNTKLRGLLVVCGLLAMAFTIVWWPGCKEYPPVTSRESMELMKLLYAACNTKDTQRMAKVEQGLSKLDQKQKLTAAEKSSFEKIIAMAKAGDWQNAEKAAFKFAQDQVGQGHAAHSNNGHQD